MKRQIAFLFPIELGSSTYLLNQLSPGNLTSDPADLEPSFLYPMIALVDNYLRHHRLHILSRGVSMQLYSQWLLPTETTMHEEALEVFFVLGREPSIAKFSWKNPRTGDEMHC